MRQSPGGVSEARRPRDLFHWTWDTLRLGKAHLPAQEHSLLKVRDHGQLNSCSFLGENTGAAHASGHRRFRPCSSTLFNIVQGRIPDPLVHQRIRYKILILRSEYSLFRSILFRMPRRLVLHRLSTRSLQRLIFHNALLLMVLPCGSPLGSHRVVFAAIRR